MTEFKLSMINWMNCIWHSDLSSHSKLIAAYLRSHMNDSHDIAWPSLSTIQARTNLSRSTVVKYIDELVSKGWLARDKETRNSTTYIAILPKFIEDGVKVISTSTPDELARMATSTSHELGSTPDKLALVREANPNKQVNKQRIDITPFHDVFWKNWREQKGRIGIKNCGSKQDSLAKFKNLFGKKSEDELQEVVNNALTELEEIMTDISVHQNNSQYFNYRNMYPQKFLGSKDWSNPDD